MEKLSQLTQTSSSTKGSLSVQNMCKNVLIKIELQGFARRETKADMPTDKIVLCFGKNEKPQINSTNTVECLKKQSNIIAKCNNATYLHNATN